MARLSEMPQDTGQDPPSPNFLRILEELMFDLWGRPTKGLVQAADPQSLRLGRQDHGGQHHLDPLAVNASSHLPSSEKLKTVWGSWTPSWTPSCLCLTFLDTFLSVLDSIFLGTFGREP